MARAVKKRDNSQKQIGLRILSAADGKVNTREHVPIWGHGGDLLISAVVVRRTRSSEFLFLQSAACGPSASRPSPSSPSRSDTPMRPTALNPFHARIAPYPVGLIHAAHPLLADCSSSGNDSSRIREAMPVAGGLMAWKFSGNFMGYEYRIQLMVLPSSAVQTRPLRRPPAHQHIRTRR